ncbi:uncharacterized protein F54H12.2-like [Lineus longissimus]|uniref:uncharacterized protein F54H12.2-like n=1 Tax=Lineus longissimus TaxID=88925 RepID=UPI00315CB941
MSLIDADSCACTKAELELFETEPTQTAITSGKLVEVHPTTSIENTDVIEFNTQTDEKNYIDLRETTIYIRAKIVKLDGTALTEKTGDTVDPKAQCYPINYLVGTMFKQAEISLSGTQIGSTSSMYAYRSYLEALLSYGKDAKTHQLRAGGYFKDVTDMETTGATISDSTATNKGAVSRFKMTKFSQSFELQGRIHNEMFEQGKLLLSKVPLTVKLTLGNPKFSLMSASTATDYKIKLEKAILMTSVKEIASYVRVAHEQRLLAANAKYPVTRIEMRYYQKAAGGSDLSEANLCKGETPRRIAIGLLASNAMNGALDGNPFNFKHYNVTSIKLTVAGASIPYGELKVDFTAKNVVNGYMTLFRGSKLWPANKSNDISLDDYVDGYALYVFNLAPDDAGSSAFQLAKNGDVGVEIKLSTATTEAVNLIVLYEYDSFVEIDADRNVYYSHGGVKGAEK